MPRLVDHETPTDSSHLSAPGGIRTPHLSDPPQTRLVVAGDEGCKVTIFKAAVVVLVAWAGIGASTPAAGTVNNGVRKEVVP